MRNGTRIFLVSLSLVIPLTLFGVTPVLGHGGGNFPFGDHYRIPYTEADVSMRLLGVEVPLEDAFEINVSETETNSSMTIIIEVRPNSGRVQGLYLEKQAVFYSSKGDQDPREFCSSGLFLK